MKLVLTLLALLAAPAALAFTGYFTWEKTYDLTETANTPDQFRLLQQKYPEQFGRYNPEQMSTASITVQKFELRGDHTCEKTDPRANFQTTTTSGCMKGENDNSGMCWASSVPMPPWYDRDPCAQ